MRELGESTPNSLPTETRSLTYSLAILIISLLLGGVVRSTFARHAIQVIAPCAALLTLRRSPAVSTYAAVPIFTFWLLVMGLICLYILNTSDFTSGTYSGIERALTAAIGAACIYGLIGI